MRISTDAERIACHDCGKSEADGDHGDDKDHTFYSVAEVRECGEVDQVEVAGMRRSIAELEAEVARLKADARSMAQSIIEAIGSVGPENAVDAVTRLVAEVKRLGAVPDVACQTCPHVRGQHMHIQRGACVVNGCACIGFVETAKS